jgi:heat shock protein HtpX
MYNRIASNVRTTWLLILGFTLLTIAVGFAFAYLTETGWIGPIIAVVVAIAMSWVSYFNADKIALRASHAQPAEREGYPQLYNVVEGLSIAAGIPMPRLYIVDDDAPNAFATGRDPERAAIAVTTGLLEKMNRDELEGVLAHELSHVENRDILVMTIAVTLVGVIVLLADWLLRALFWGGLTGGRSRDQGGGAGAILALVGIVLLVVAPLIAQLMKLAVSRRREYLADADAVNFTRNPEGLISALNKLKADSTVVRSATRATAHLWIEEPNAMRAEHGPKGATRSGAWLNRLFSTHPPLDDRIKALQEMAYGGMPNTMREQPPQQ